MDDNINNQNPENIGGEPEQTNQQPNPTPPNSIEGQEAYEPSYYAQPKDATPNAPQTGAYQQPQNNQPQSPPQPNGYQPQNPYTNGTVYTNPSAYPTPPAYNQQNQQPNSYNTQQTPPMNSYPGQVNPNNINPNDNQAAYNWDFETINQTATAKGPKKKNKGLRVFTGIVASFALIFVSSFAVYGIYVASTGETPDLTGGNGIFTPEAQGGEGSTEKPGININPMPDGIDQYAENHAVGTLSNNEIHKKVSPSVVGVVAYIGNSYFGGEGEGSGIIMSSDGYVITNAHVVEGSQMIDVVLTNGETYPATIVGMDVATDLAVLKVEATDLPAAEFGDSDALEIGDRLVAIGNPGGLQFASSQTVGSVSALDRSISVGDSGYALELIQTDAAINPGNSGGALINAYGQVIGINSAKISGDGFEGMGFAIPITDAMPIIDDIIANGKVTGRPMLGITAEQVTPTAALENGIPMGLLIREFTIDSSLPAAGLKIQDIITHIDGNPVYTVDSTSEILKNKKAGDAIEITYYRRDGRGKGESYTTVATLVGGD